MTAHNANSSQLDKGNRKVRELFERDRYIPDSEEGEEEDKDDE